MNRGKIALCCLAALLVLCLAGCRLALPDKGESNGGDKLVGVLVTTEYLDLFDTEGYLKDNLMGSPDGNITVERNASEYQGRLYAKPLTNEKGEMTEPYRFVFEGVSGIPFVSAKVPDPVHGNNYLTGADEAISDSHTTINSGDNENSLAIEGTLYVTPNSSVDHRYYLNPVYQSADGRVYATSGTGVSVGVLYGEEAQESTVSDGDEVTQTLSASYTSTENGKTMKESMSVKLTIHVMKPPDKIVVLQMDRNSAVLSRQEYEPGKLPGEITPAPGAEYIVVETHMTDSAGKEQVSRAIYGKDADSLVTFRCREDGICVKQMTPVKWAE